MWCGAKYSVMPRRSRPCSGASATAGLTACAATPIATPVPDNLKQVRVPYTADYVFFVGV